MSSTSILKTQMKQSILHLEREQIHLAEKHKKLTAEAKELKKAGIAHGTIWEQEKRPGYVVTYLHHKTDGSQRKREYIGNDKAKIKDAKARIKRGARWTKVQRDLELIEQAVKQFTRGSHRVIEQTRAASHGQTQWQW